MTSSSSDGLLQPLVDNSDNTSDDAEDFEINTQASQQRGKGKSYIPVVSYRSKALAQKAVADWFDGTKWKYVKKAVTYEGKNSRIYSYYHSQFSILYFILNLRRQIKL